MEQSYIFNAYLKEKLLPRSKLTGPPLSAPYCKTVTLTEQPHEAQPWQVNVALTSGHLILLMLLGSCHRSRERRLRHCTSYCTLRQVSGLRASHEVGDSNEADSISMGITCILENISCSCGLSDFEADGVAGVGKCGGVQSSSQYCYK